MLDGFTYKGAEYGLGSSQGSVCKNSYHTHKDVKVLGWRPDVRKTTGEMCSDVLMKGP